MKILNNKGVLFPGLNLVTLIVNIDRKMLQNVCYGILKRFFFEFWNIFRMGIVAGSFSVYVARVEYILRLWNKFA